MKKTTTLRFAAMLAIALTATSTLSSCAASAPSNVTTASASKEAGVFTKEVRTCVTNDSKEHATLVWAADLKSPTGTGYLDVGETFCAQGEATEALLTFPDSVKTAILANNPVIGYPFIKFRSGPNHTITVCDLGRCFEEYETVTFASAGYSQGETVNSDVEGHHLSATREGNTDVINFAISILD